MTAGKNGTPIIFEVPRATPPTIGDVMEVRLPLCLGSLQPCGGWDGSFEDHHLEAISCKRLFTADWLTLRGPGDSTMERRASRPPHHVRPSWTEPRRLSGNM